MLAVVSSFIGWLKTQVIPKRLRCIAMIHLAINTATNPVLCQGVDSKRTILVFDHESDISWEGGVRKSLKLNIFYINIYDIYNLGISGYLIYVC